MVMFFFFFNSRQLGCTETLSHDCASRSRSFAHCAFHLCRCSSNPQIAPAIRRARRSCIDCILSKWQAQLQRISRQFPYTVGLDVGAFNPRSERKKHNEGKISGSTHRNYWIYWTNFCLFYTSFLHVTEIFTLVNSGLALPTAAVALFTSYLGPIYLFCHICMTHKVRYVKLFK